MKHIKLPSLIILLPYLLLVTACKTDYANLPTYTPTRQLQAVIEVPAGTNQQLYYNRQSNTFEPQKGFSQNQVIKFLPYPGNFGFIPSTEINKDGKSLEVLVIAEAVETGTVMEVIPIGVLQLEKEGELDHKIIATPARPSEQLIAATDFYTFSLQYPAVKQILEQWFVHHNPGKQTKLVGWRDEKFAEKEIQRWMKL